MPLNNRKKGQVGNPTGKGGWVAGRSGNPEGTRPPDSKMLDLRDMARKLTRGAMATILAIMRNPGNQPNVRLTAAAMVLERGHGKPIQPVSNPDLSPLNLGDMSDDDLARLAARTSQAASALAAATKH